MMIVYSPIKDLIRYKDEYGLVKHLYENGTKQTVFLTVQEYLFYKEGLKVVRELELIRKSLVGRPIDTSILPFRILPTEDVVEKLARMGLGESYWSDIFKNILISFCNPISLDYFVQLE